MLDIKFIKENPSLVKEAARKKRVDFNVDKFLDIDDERRELLRKIEEMRSKQNALSRRIPRIKNEEEKNEELRELRELKYDLLQQEEDFKKIDAKWRAFMLEVPNIPDPSVPEGGEADFREERKWGEIREFSFPVKNSIDLMKDLDLLDLERGAKVSGFRGYFLKNEAVTLSQALWFLAIEKISGKGYTPVIAPALVRGKNLFGTGHFPQSKDDVYRLADDELYLSATAEIPLMGFYADEILQEKELPKKFLAFSPCFRREAGSYSRDTKGIYRLHEFYKVEQLILSVANHQDSVNLHEELTANSEEILKELKIPHRVITIAAGDTGRAHVKTYDIEVWIPSEKRYRESHSSSYYHDFQTRRLNIRYQDQEGKMHFCYSLNDTAIATPRILISLLENYQQKDGSVVVPEVLRKYLGKDAITRH